MTGTPGRHGRCKAAILLSGSGTNLQAFIDQIAARQLELDIVLVLSNRADAFGLTRAANAGIDRVCIVHDDYADRESFDRAMAAELDRRHPELILLAGFMRILSPWFVRRYEGRVLNIHPALLPAYPGLHTHERVLRSGDTWHGSTVHFVTEELDGGPRLLQGRLAVDPKETPEQLAGRVQAVEHRIYPQAARWFEAGRLDYRDGRIFLDGTRLHEPVLYDFP